MTEVLVFDPPEAEKVRGYSPKDGRSALDPVPLKDGRFFLGVEVIDDPAHADVRDFLRSMPLVDIEKLPRFAEEDERPDVLEAADLKPREAQILTVRKAEAPAIRGR